MKHISLDTATDAIKQFVRTLPLEAEGVGLELDGEVICTVLPAEVSEAEATALIKRGRELVQQSRQRNQGVSARDIEREVQQAVDEVRGRQA